MRLTKGIICRVLPCLLLPSCHEGRPPEPREPLPSEAQLAWHEMEYCMFVHFSINTFTDREWGYGDESPDLFNPASLDAGQWARVAREAGMKGIILTAKHHDGFCLFPSAYTDHSVKNAPFRNGQGDVLRELADACRAEGLKMGLYLSPWDRNRADYGSASYVDYYREQLREILTGYGDIFELWFDGANGGEGYYGGARDNRRIDRVHYYDWENTWAGVRQLQPQTLIFSDAGPDIRWVGNENGLGNETNWCLLKRDEFYPGTPDYHLLGEGQEDGTHWVPAEVDVSIRPGWFYHESENDRVKTPEQLLEIWYASVGRNCNLLLNVPPDRRGLIHKTDSASLMGFLKLRKKEFETNLALGMPAASSAERGRLFSASMVTDGDQETYWAAPDRTDHAELVIDLASEQEVNRIVLQEYIRMGQRVKSFGVDAWLNGQWQNLLGGTTIGYKVIRRFPLTKTDRIRIRIIDASACPTLSNVEIYRAPGN